MDQFQIQDALDGINRNGLVDIIDKASKLLSEMDNQAIGAFENAQAIMKENKSRRFPDSEREPLERYWGFKRGYTQWSEALKAVSKHNKIKYAVAAFAEATNTPPTREFVSILRTLYGCQSEPKTKEWEEARERFWSKF